MTWILTDKGLVPKEEYKKRDFLPIMRIEFPKSDYSFVDEFISKCMGELETANELRSLSRFSAPLLDSNAPTAKEQRFLSGRDS